MRRPAASCRISSTQGAERVRVRDAGLRIGDGRSEFRREGNNVTRDEAWTLANHWVESWNAHDLGEIMSHYEEDVRLTSPVAARLLEVADGRVIGKSDLRTYFERGLTAFPDLTFHLEDVLWGLNSVVLYYTNQRGTRTAEFMELGAGGKVARVIAHYNA